MGDTQLLRYKSSLSSKIKQLEQDLEEKGRKVTLSLSLPAWGTIFLLCSSSLIHDGRFSVDLLLTLLLIL